MEKYLNITSHVIGALIERFGNLGQITSVSVKPCECDGVLEMHNGTFMEDIDVVDIEAFSIEYIAHGSTVKVNVDLETAHIQYDNENIHSMDIRQFQYSGACGTIQPNGQIVWESIMRAIFEEVYNFCDKNQ